MTGWRVENAEWVRRRELQWPAVEAELARSWVHNRRAMKRLKDYFLTGRIDPKFEFKEPNLGGPMPLVFRMWLHPDRSQRVFNKLLAEGNCALRFSEYCVGRMTLSPPASFDDVAPMFYELFYLRRKKMKPETRDQLALFGLRSEFPPPKVWAYFKMWVMAEDPRQNPICKFMMSKLDGMTDDDDAASVEYYKLDSPKAFVENLKRILASRNDPRTDSVRELRSMLKSGKLPPKVSSMLQKHGLK